MVELVFRVTGQDSRRLADELASLLRQEFGLESQPAPEAPGGTLAHDAIAVAGLDVSIPAEVLARLSGLDKAHAQRTVGKLVAWAAERRNQGTIEVTTPSGAVEELADVEPGKLLHEATQSPMRPATSSVGERAAPSP